MNNINEPDHLIYKTSITRTQNIDGKLEKTRLRENKICFIIFFSNIRN